MAVVIPWHPRDPLHLLYRTANTYVQYGFDVIVVAPQLTYKLSFIPRVTQLKEKIPNVGGARATGIEHAYRQGYDCIVVSDSHLSLTEDPSTLCRYPTFASAPHSPVPFVKIYSSHIYLDGNVLYWCTVFNNTETIPMTNEPLIAFRRTFLDEVIPYIFEYTSYALDYAWMLYSDKYGYIYDKVIFSHDNPLKPIRRPEKAEVVKLASEWPRLMPKLDQWAQQHQPRRLCAPIATL